MLSVVFTLLLSNTAVAQDTTAKLAEETGTNATVWFYVLLFVAFVLILSVIGKTIKVLELTYELNDKKLDIKWNRINAALFIVFLVGFIGLSLWEMKYHGDMLLPESGSEHGVKIDKLFNITLWVTGAVFVITHILLFYFAFKYQGSSKRKAYFYPHNDKLELYWTIIPAIVLTVLVISGWKTWNDITQPAPEESLVLDVTAKQFGWIVRYPGTDNMLGSKTFKYVNDVNETGIDFKDKNALDDVMAREIYLPVNKPVKFIFGAKDVIHSAYMPHFRAQMNCVPGMPTTFWFTPRITTEEMRAKTGDEKFDYVLLCAKICGSAHFNMQVKIVVVKEPEYKNWLNKQKPYYTQDIAKQIEEAQAAREQKDAERLAMNK